MAAHNVYFSFILYLENPSQIQKFAKCFLINFRDFIDSKISQDKLSQIKEVFGKTGTFSGKKLRNYIKSQFHRINFHK